MKAFRMDARRIWFLLLAVCVVIAQIWIFGHSMRNADESLAESDTVVEIVRPVVEPILQEANVSTEYENLSYIVRKMAHFAEYALLGFLCLLCTWLSPIKGRWRLALPLPYCALSAGVDECIQMNYSERSAQWSDVLLDSCGAAAGILFASLCLALVLLIYRKRKNKIEFHKEQQT